MKIQNFGGFVWTVNWQVLWLAKWLSPLSLSLLIYKICVLRFTKVSEMCFYIYNRHKFFPIFLSAWNVHFLFFLFRIKKIFVFVEDEVHPL